MPSALKIYKASAGSGKTFALTMEFFKIVFASPREYKNVLAVTFTNKATEEMKSRVVKELHKLARGEESAYRRELAAALLLSDEQLKERATLLQTAILHDYGRFSVTTIDAFFQRLIKAFARELGVFYGYNTELNTNHVLGQAVERLLQRAGEERALGRWITELMERNVEDARSWSVKENIRALGEELFREHYKLFDETLLERFADRDFLGSYRRFLDDAVSLLETELAGIGARGCQVMREAGLEAADFKQGARGFISLFARVQEGVPDAISATARATVDDPDAWTARQKAAAVVARVRSAYPLLNSLLRDLIALYDAGNKAYRSAALLQANLYQLGILNDLYREVRGYCEENGVMLLSDTAHLLNLLVGGNDVSFIFERSGNFYNHVMIDEFQDTSTLQWANFRPLIANTLAGGGKAMLVGDVKQSIYRWRNGDWRLLATGAGEQFRHLGVENTTLGCNWRSQRQIVHFNNAFFKEAARRLARVFDEEFGSDDNPYSKAITSAYDDVEQEPRAGGEGLVEIHFSNLDDEEADEEIMERATRAIRDARARGVPLKDCVILARTAEEGAFVADYLMEYNRQEDDDAAKIPFVSSDSLFVSSSPRVRLIIQALRLIAEPFDDVNRAALLYYYHAFVRDGDPARLDDLFRSIHQPPLAELEWLSRPVNPLSGSLFEGVEEIIRRLGLGDRAEETPYLVAFQEAVFDYESSNTNSIPLFLEWWEKEESKRVLSTSGDADAVRVMTIHKSKGLEFQVVILPFCSWELDATRPLRRVWARNREEGFRVLEMAPLNYSARLKDSYFSDDYHEEHVKSYVDNLNLLYVAATRACRELHVFPRDPKIARDGRPVTIGALLLQTLDDLALPTWNAPLRRLLAGRPESLAAPPPPTADHLRLEQYPVHPPAGRLAIRYRHRDFTNDPAAPLSPLPATPLNEGKLLHELFRRVITRADVPRAARSLRQEGLIPAGEETIYARRVEEYLSRPAVASWFDGRHRAINEREILLPAGRRVRPDRVMLAGSSVIVVDYKFGRVESPDHVAQVRLYCSSLSLMDYPSVSGYLWYVTLDKILRVV
ncbi:MAG: UvrD-helicase domain-containing protein [Odoribacteraceae bacterium]|jgi:ATP-dependent exoDNAse (exonuclease V) beta subunit|nr:UvrD-helicase domain-containing protein [Odoribacteraceae bacterium]